MKNLGASKDEAKAFVKQLRSTIRKKLATSPMRWPISRQDLLFGLNLRICFGKNLSPYLVIFKVFEESGTVLIYDIVWEKSNYAALFEMDNRE
jgi:hypothetical protein